MKITIIGAGNIGGAIARGLAKGRMFKASDITCTAQSQATLDKIKAANPDFCRIVRQRRSSQGSRHHCHCCKTLAGGRNRRPDKGCTRFRQTDHRFSSRRNHFRDSEYLSDQENQLRGLGHPQHFSASCPIQRSKC